jgi:hypothetical protein
MTTINEKLCPMSSNSDGMFHPCSPLCAWRVQIPRTTYADEPLPSDPSTGETCAITLLATTARGLAFGRMKGLLIDICRALSQGAFRW